MEPPRAFIAACSLFIVFPKRDSFHPEPVKPLFLFPPKPSSRPKNSPPDPDIYKHQPRPMIKSPPRPQTSTYRRNNLSIGQHLTGLFFRPGSSILQSYCSISNNSHAFRSPSKPFRFVPFRFVCETIGSSEAGKVEIGGAMNE